MSMMELWSDTRRRAPDPERYIRRALSSMLGAAVLITTGACGWGTGVTYRLAGPQVERLDRPGAPTGHNEARDSTHRFQDDWIAVAIVPDDGTFNLELANRSGETVRILWDEAAYVSATGKASRVVPGATRIIEMNRPVVPAVVPPGSHVSSVVVPLGNWVAADYGAGYVADFVGPCDDAAALEGRAFSLTLPVERSGDRREYRFSFRLQNVVIPEPSVTYRRTYCR